MSTTKEAKEKAREKLREIAAKFKQRGDHLGWFDAVYSEAQGDIENIPWADLEPNRFLRSWAERHGLKGDGRKALVVGCGLGDDARYLAELGFDVTAFDISPTAIEWAKRLNAEGRIQFETADLFQPPRGWLGNFEFVLEIYTIQPLPMEMRNKAIDAVASFVAPGGELLVICHGREDNEATEQIPYPLSRGDLKRFEDNGLTQNEFTKVMDDDEDPPKMRFIVEYRRP
jgi:SAM-dependent methyltransferase